MSDDLIRRQDAIDALERIFDRCEEIEAHFSDGDPDKTGYEMFPDYMTVWKYLHQLPSAQQEITVDHALTEEEIKNIKQKMADSPIVFIPSSQPEPKWIPRSERLPKEGEDVLIQFKEGQDCPYKKFQVGHLGTHDVEDLHFKKIGVKSVWYAENGYFDFDKVVAWMPLPKPWKGEQE